MSIKEYWWVSVAGASCEPAVVVEEEGERRAYTIGCKDYFSVGKEDCLLKLIEKCDDANGIPLTPKQEKAEWRKEQRRLKELSAHCYRRFGESK